MQQELSMMYQVIRFMLDWLNQEQLPRPPGTATTAAYWQITKLTYDGSNNCTAVEYAEGSWAFEYTWSLRATYTYE